MSLKNKLSSALIILISMLCNHAVGDTIEYTGTKIIAGNNVYVLEAHIELSGYSDIKLNPSFIEHNAQVPNFDLSLSDHWIKFWINNKSTNETIGIEVSYALIDTCELYYEENHLVKKVLISSNQPYNIRNINYQNPVFFVHHPINHVREYYIRVKGGEQLIVPLLIANQKELQADMLVRDLIMGLLMGIMLVMMFYNLFIYFSTKDNSYIHYVLYILFITLTHFTITGYSFKYLFFAAPQVNNLTIILFPSLAGIFAIRFIQSFLHTNEKTPLLHKLITCVGIIYLLAPATRLAGYDIQSYRMIDAAGGVGTLLTLIISIKLSYNDYRPAKFFLAAWIIFLIGLILFIFRNLNLLAYNNFTNYTLQIGTALEVTLLSFALADKINILKKEKEASQEEALRVLQENERIVREQNIMLEKRVEERTVELTKSNQDLNFALQKLKDAQTQLVDAEKMASLGQLTAGIAHEINNPINFVSSNIRPLRRDVEDIISILEKYDTLQEHFSQEEIRSLLLDVKQFKEEVDYTYVRQEIEMLLKGMDEGASRTVEIVKGLKNFSRLDEAEIKYANINEGILSTLILLNNQVGDKIKIEKNLGNLPDIECYPGKLNQVFMNLFNNAIYAVRNHQDGSGTVTVSTKFEDDMVVIRIADTGMGIPDDVKANIFDPFFTTKEVGEGTGLGLSIVYKIIEMHKGRITVNSAPNEGAEFVIILPKVLK